MSTQAETNAAVAAVCAPDGTPDIMALIGVPWQQLVEAVAEYATSGGPVGTNTPTEDCVERVKQINILVDPLTIRYRTVITTLACKLKIEGETMPLAERANRAAESAREEKVAKKAQKSARVALKRATDHADKCDEEVTKRARQSSDTLRLLEAQQCVEGLCSLDQLNTASAHYQLEEPPLDFGFMVQSGDEAGLSAA